MCWVKQIDEKLISENLFKVVRKNKRSQRKTRFFCLYWKNFIWKPDKGNRIELIGTNDYYTAVENLFSDKSKFKEIYNNPTPARLSSIQRYLKKLNNRNELNDEVVKKIQPQNTKLAIAHGVPKIHKTFHSIPPFHTIIDTTGTRHYSAGKYLLELLNPLKQNMYIHS